jgi:hypothetical protein
MSLVRSALQAHLVSTKRSDVSAGVTSICCVPHRHDYAAALDAMRSYRVFATPKKRTDMKT